MLGTRFKRDQISCSHLGGVADDWGGPEAGGGGGGQALGGGGGGGGGGGRLQDSMRQPGPPFGRRIEKKKKGKIEK
jgi:hypothetical protein